MVAVTPEGQLRGRWSRSEALGLGLLLVTAAIWWADVQHGRLGAVHEHKPLPAYVCACCPLACTLKCGLCIDRCTDGGISTMHACWACRLLPHGLHDDTGLVCA